MSDSHASAGHGHPPDDDVEIGAGGVSAAAPADTERLRVGLAALAGLLAVFHLLFALLRATSHPEAADVGIGWLLARVGVDVAVAGLALSPWGRDRRVLRAAEGLLILAEMVFLFQSQYRTVLTLIETRDFVDAVAVAKNGVLRTVIVMLAAAAFLPHAPATTARISVSLAAAIILCHALVLHHADTDGVAMDDVANRQIVMTNALFLLMAGVVATAVAWGLSRRRAGPGPAGFADAYRLVRLLGTRGSGDVYLAEQRCLGRPCAVKIVHADRRHPEELARFERESRAASLLRHPAAVAILDSGRTDDGSAYCAMEYLPGLSLAMIVGQFGPLAPGRAVHLARQMCGALGEAHRQGLLHGNVAPTNVFVSVLGGECDVAKMVDFGVEAGTPGFVAPERSAADADGRADLYGLGALLYYMLTGAPPAPPGADGAAPHPRQRRPDLPADLDAVVARLLSARPGDRFPTAAAVAAALEGCGCAADWGQDRAAAWWHDRVRPAAASSPDTPSRE
jgi:serine/threonine-protein kinase